MLLFVRYSVNDIVAFSKFLNEFRYFLRWILQIVVKRYDNLMLCGADAAQYCIVLAVVTHQVDTANPLMLGRELSDRFPAAIFTPVINKDKFVTFAQSAQNRRQP